MKTNEIEFVAPFVVSSLCSVFYSNLKMIFRCVVHLYNMKCSGAFLEMLEMFVAHMKARGDVFI